MNKIFRDRLDQFVIIYIDNILIYSQSLPDHICHISRVLQHLLQNHIYFMLEKSEFHTTSIHFLGYNISYNFVSIDQGTVDALKHWPQLKNPTTFRICKLLLMVHPQL